MSITQTEQEPEAQVAVLRSEPIQVFSPKLRPGVEVEITYRAVVANNTEVQTTALVVERGDQLWYETGPCTVRIVPPDVVPGCVLRAGGALWTVRKSNNRDTLRIMPADLSGNLRTLPIEVFIERYPLPKVVFDPRRSE